MASSPFVVRVGDPGKVQVAHVRSEELFAERVIKNEVDLAVEGSNDMNYDDFTAQVTSPDGENVPCIVNKGTDDRVHVKFTPHKPGPYKVKLVSSEIRGQSLTRKELFFNLESRNA